MQQLCEQEFKQALQELPLGWPKGLDLLLPNISWCPQVPQPSSGMLCEKDRKALKEKGASNGEE
jgi:hypothetical protein